MTDPTARERAVIALLEGWPWKLGGTLIGGYAIAAYGAPRYSDDVDFVIPDDARTATEAWLRDQGFEDAKGERAKSTQVFEDAPRFSRDEVTLDLLVGYVRDRDARVEIPESWISLRRRLERLDLISGRLDRKVPIARPEALWALKLQAGRDQDLTDLFTISKEPVKAREVRSLFQSLMVRGLAAKLRAVELKLEGSKLYDDSRSRMGLKNGDAVSARWMRFREQVSSMIPQEESVTDC
ncbi:MAG: nucleotidyl transferase AbiEii/AbiGii toxin family protein [Thermoplasmata archaeon]